MNDECLHHARAQIAHALGGVESVVNHRQAAHRLIAGAFRAIGGKRGCEPRNRNATGPLDRFERVRIFFLWKDAARPAISIVRLDQSKLRCGPHMKIGREVVEVAHDVRQSGNRFSCVIRLAAELGVFHQSGKAKQLRGAQTIQRP